MAKIIKLTEFTVTIGFEDGTAKNYDLSCLNFDNPYIGEEVEIYDDSGIPIIAQRTPRYANGIGNWNSERDVISGKTYVNKMIYCLLALCFGTIGLHMFYARKVTKGVLMVLFCWTAIPTIISLIQAISAVMQPADQYGMILV